MAKVFAQIVIDLEMDELSISGTRLDIMGISQVVERCVKDLPIHGKQIRVTEVYSPTKDWQIGAQLKLAQSFNDHALDAETALDRITELMSSKNWSPDTISVVADYVRATGREIKDLDDE